jgi:hypothetical protein
VNAARRDKPEQMQDAAGAFDMSEALLQDRIGCERSVINCPVDAGHALQYDPAGTEVEMPNLAVALLPFGKSDCFLGCT